MKIKNFHPKPRPPSPHNFFDISMFSDQKEIKGVDKDKDKTVVYFLLGFCRK